MLFENENVTETGECFLRLSEVFVLFRLPFDFTLLVLTSACDSVFLENRHCNLVKFFFKQACVNP